MLVHFKEILQAKVEEHRALGSFNAFNLETAKAIVKAAKESGMPLSVQTTETAIQYAGLKNLYILIKTVIEEESGMVPVSIHLDHGKNLEIIEACLKIGYTSVHCDASALPFEDNIGMTKEAAEMAHEHGALVQGELGNILGKEGLIKIQQGLNFKKLLTSPEQIAEYAERTGVDTVAVSLGNLHGQFVGEENLDFDRLQAIHEKIQIPIVLHGGSGIADDQIRKAISLGVRIINIDTDLRIVFLNAIKNSLAMKKDRVDPREPLAQGMAAITEAVKNKARLFNLS